MDQSNEMHLITSQYSVPLKPLACGLIASTFLGCVGLQERYVETHVIKNLTVVFLDEQSLREQWEHTAGSDAVRFLPQVNTTIPLVRTVQGFYDFTSNTLYCPKWNFEVCGHELHHAALGHFHHSH